MRSPRFRSLVLLLATFALAMSWPRAVVAQDGFLFRQPLVGLTFRAGPSLFLAGGDLFDEMRDRLTLEQGDFSTASFGGELVIMPLSRLDLAIGVMYSQMKSNSEFRHWTEPDPNNPGGELPIRQQTQLRMVPITVSARYLLVPRGRRISELSWVPRNLIPYVGAGAGLTVFKLRQDGDFVDEVSNPQAPPIFTSYFESDGSDVTLHALAGVDYWFVPRFGVNVEARYVHGSATPNKSFSSYDNLDLSGVQATLGLSVRW